MISSSRRLLKHRTIHIDFHSLKTRSRKVNWLKKVLPFMALILLVILVFWSGGTKIVFLKSKDVAAATLTVFENNMALNPRFNGVDGHGRPYTVWAEKGSQVSTNTLYLTHPKFNLKLSPNESVELEAKEGVFFKDRNILELKKDVILRHFQGHVITTSSATIDFKQGIVVGNDPVTGQGPNGTIQAQGFKLLKEGKKLTFLGRPELTIKTIAKGR
jgi:lipopolysaccharide export system protein LptC